MEANFQGAPLSVLDDVLVSHGLRVVSAKALEGVRLSGPLRCSTRGELAYSVAAMTGAPAEFIGNTLFVGPMVDDERFAVVFRAPFASPDLLKAVCAASDVQTIPVDESGVWVRGSPDALRRIEQSVNVLRGTSGPSCVLKVWLVRVDATADLSYKPLKIDFEASAGNAALDGVFAFGSTFKSTATTVVSVPKTNVGQQGNVEVTGFTEIPIGFQASAVCRDLGQVCEVRLSLSDGDALDGRDPPTRSVNTFDVVAIIPYRVDSLVGSLAKTSKHVGLKMPIAANIGGAMHRYRVVVRVEKASAPPTLETATK